MVLVDAQAAVVDDHQVNAFLVPSMVATDVLQAITLLVLVAGNVMSVGNIDIAEIDLKRYLKIAK